MSQHATCDWTLSQPSAMRKVALCQDGCKDVTVPTCLARGHLLILAGDLEMNPGPSLQQLPVLLGATC